MPADSTPVTRLIAPRLALASCVRAFLVRDTTGCALLPPAQRLNRFPAAPMCSIAWTISGELEAAAPGLSVADVRMPPALFGGPRSYPLVSYNPGPVHSFVVMFYPAALHALTGVAMGAAGQVAPPLAEQLHCGLTSPLGMGSLMDTPVAGRAPRLVTVTR